MFNLGVLRHLVEAVFDYSSYAFLDFLQDTNPIFLFNRDAIESERQPDLTSDSFQAVPDEEEAKVAVEAVLSLPVSFNSVVTRTQLAQVCSLNFAFCYSSCS